MPDTFGCRCSCLDPALLSVAIPDDHFAMYRYRFAPTCITTTVFDFTTPDYQPTWNGISDGGLTAVLTSAGISIGDVELEIFDGATLVARYLNDVVWQPNCDTQMRLTYYDPTWEDYECGLWQANPCLSPTLDPCSDCECGLSRVVFTVDWAGVSTTYDTMEDNYPGFNAVVDGRFTLQCITIEDLTALSLGFTTGDCFWIARAFLEHVNTVDSITIYCVVQFFKTGDGGDFNVHLLFDESAAPVDLAALAGASLGTESGWCQDGPWALDETAHPLFDLSAVVNAIQIPETIRPEIRFDCTPPPDAATCNGESLWTLKAFTFGGRYLFYWQQDSETCAGTCNNGNTCQSAPPFALPTGYIDADEADALGIFDLINEQMAGYCGCVPVYDPPDPITPCDGTSTWTLRRDLCEDLGVPSKYIYYWEPGNNTCTGECPVSEDCLPQPPYALTTTPITDDEAAALGYDDALDEADNSGTCDCEEDAYSPPACPECEDCDDVTGDKDFTIAGITGGDSGFNGTYTLVKQAPSCQWVGDNGNPSFQATLEFFGTFWELVFTDGSTTTYRLTSSDPCVNPIVLSKFSGATEFPATVTVDNV